MVRVIRTPLPTTAHNQRALLVGAELRADAQMLSVQDSLDELALLAHTAGLAVVGRLTQRLERPNAATYIGSGKVIELVELIEEAAAELVIFDSELSPRHQRELEKSLEERAQLLDRSALILDIFARHANTREGALQVELAQYEYRLPRLTRQWTHLARQAGGASGRTGSVGGVGLRGPGETQLEVDRREITRRITRLKAELQKVREHRSRHRQQRRRSRVPVVALVGYTNAGKSTLLRALSGADVLVADRLFATLDPTTRRIEVAGGRPFLLTDTVGFIQKLPATLVAAFRATLEEITEADLLLHVIDCAHQNAAEQAQVVLQTLVEIGVGAVPVITAVNKTDRLPAGKPPEALVSEFSDAVAVSGLAHSGLERLQAAIQGVLHKSLVEMTVELPYTEGDLISLFHRHALVSAVEHGESGVRLRGELPQRIAARFRDRRSSCIDVTARFRGCGAKSKKPRRTRR